MSSLFPLVALCALYWGIRIIVSVARAAGSTFHVTPESAAEVPDDETVSVCIPARNEEGRVGFTVADVLAQDHEGLLEVLVVDDASTDGTAAEIVAAGAGDPRLRVLAGQGPPAGWKGKQAAVWRAQGEARGRWLCFVDADVRLHPSALRVALAQARLRDAHMVSWLGQLTTESFWEHVLMPFIGDLVLLFTKPRFVNDPTRSDCLANGQFILIRRDAYDAVGGHEAIRASVIDDVSLARSVKFHEPKGSLRYALLTSTGLMQVRMYEDLPGIWAGWTKNLYAAGGERVDKMLLLVAYLLWSGVLPWVTLPLALALGATPVAQASAVAVGLSLMYRLGVRRLMPQPWFSAFLHPLAAGITAGIALDSLLRGRGWRKPVQWKGRDV